MLDLITERCYFNIGSTDGPHVECPLLDCSELEYQRIEELRSSSPESSREFSFLLGRPGPWFGSIKHKKK